MSMSSAQIQSFVLRYLEAEQCDIIEKHPAYVTVKLSPSADRDLTHRPYYWSFVERTGVTPETMICTFIFDPDTYRELHPQPQQPGPQADPRVSAPQVATAAGQPPQGDSILGRYFGFVPTTYTARIPRDELTYGSRRLEQIFAAVRAKGRFVRLFEAYSAPQTQAQAGQLQSTVPYETWLAVNYKVELTCDMKRSEYHSIGIQLQTGEIREQFQEWVSSRRLTPRLPARVYIMPDKLTLPRAVLFLEQHMEQKLSRYDHSWADHANVRLREEHNRVRDYYEALLKASEPEARAGIEAQFERRTQEVDWQHRPRIQISAINCGLFHVTASNRQLS
ncbi:YqhG family protein [Paenibacillus puerhi]|uniref:YqhG family protein n=1 Tax=Paenibacillus puerhi TaxID=2692622 RepID=UPI001F2084C8|nr:YqhG family protein [Paenibacillus puerhi]